MPDPRPRKQGNSPDRSHLPPSRVRTVLPTELLRSLGRGGGWYLGERAWRGPERQVQVARHELRGGLGALPVLGSERRRQRTLVLVVLPAVVEGLPAARLPLRLRSEKEKSAGLPRDVVAWWIALVIVRASERRLLHKIIHRKSKMEKLRE